MIKKAQDKLKNLPEFANDFEQIVHAPPYGLSLSARSGLCLIRMDGNDFGALRAKQTRLDGYRRLAEHLDILKARLMAVVICWLAKRRDMAVAVKTEDDEGERTRFETVLWGGDEFAFVCPAWAGWSLAQAIAAETAEWHDLAGQPLTFGTGIGFAKHKTPIAQFLEAVEVLEAVASRVKKVSRVLALSWEGVDRVHLDPEDYMKRLYRADDAAEALAFKAEDLETWVTWKNDLTRAVGRSALHRWAMLFRGEDEETAWNHVYGEIKRIGGDRGVSLWAEIGQANRPWLKLQQILYLHDYLDPLDSAAPAKGDEAAA